MFWDQIIHDIHGNVDSNLLKIFSSQINVIYNYLVFVVVYYSIYFIFFSVKIFLKQA